MSVNDYLPDFTSDDIQFNPANQHCTFTQTRNGQGVTTKFTVIGFADPIFALRERFPKHSQHDKFGTLTDLEISQSEGPHWLATFTYSKEVADDDTESGTGTLTGPKSSQLTVRMMSIPIEAASKYVFHWNNDLWVDHNWWMFRNEYLKTHTYWEREGDYGNTIQMNITQLLDYIYDNDGFIYWEDGLRYHIHLTEYYGLQDFVKWSPTPPSVQPPNGCTSNYSIRPGGSASRVEEDRLLYGGTYRYDLTQIYYKRDWWTPLRHMTKPGVSTFDYPVYEMTEVSKHVGKKAAGWAIAEAAGRIVSPKYGDFGITDQLGGNWLCLGGNVTHNGDFWQASRSYQHSPDGWDEDLYKEGQRRR